MASVSKCPVVIQFQCRPCVTGESGASGACLQKGRYRRVFPTLRKVRGWLSWLSHIGGRTYGGNEYT